jgi:hypothetical protein
MLLFIFADGVGIVRQHTTAAASHSRTIENRMAAAKKARMGYRFFIPFPSVVGDIQNTALLEQNCFQNPMMLYPQST